RKPSPMARTRIFTAIGMVALGWMYGCARPARIALRPPAPEAIHDTDDDDDKDADEGPEAGPRGALEYNLMKRLPEGATDLSPELAMEAQRQIQRMRPNVSARASEPSAAGLVWTNVGPGNIGGRTRSILIHPQDPNTLYAGAVTGGVWKSVDGGKNWN